MTHLSDKQVPGMHYVSKKDDGEGAGTGIVFYVQRGSTGNDYQKAIQALKARMNFENSNKIRASSMLSEEARN